MAVITIISLNPHPGCATVGLQTAPPYFQSGLFQIVAPKLPKIAFMIRKKTIDIPAPAGKVTTHEVAISPTARRFMLSIPLAIPTPKTAPTNVCVVEIGNPNLDASTTVGWKQWLPVVQ